MGFLAGFEDDVFISYAHNDNDPFGPEKCGWVELLHEQLAKRIKFYLNQPPILWRDPDLKANEMWDDKIANRLSRSAIFLTILSDNYLERPYCQLEVQVFHKKAGPELKVGEKCRIFKVELRPVTRNKLLPEFDGTGMYSFFRSTGDRELRPGTFPEDWPKYSENIDSLAHDIADTLRAMQQGVPCGGRGTAPTGTVFLAQTTSDQRDVREKIRRDLQDRNFTILPTGDLPEDGDAFEKIVRECLNQAEISIHIFGASAGFKPDGRDRASTWLQHDLAMERANDPEFHRIVWLPPERESAKEEQRDYLKHLQEDPAAQKGAEILWGKIEDLKKQVNDSLEDIRRKREERNKPKTEAKETKEATPAPGGGEGAPLSVYLICDERDLQSPTFDALQDYLFGQGYQPLTSLPAENPEEARTVHERLIQESDACLIYFGAASMGWVTANVSNCQKLGINRKKPFLSTGVYVAPPSDTKPKCRVFFGSVMLGGAEFAPEQLTPFLSALQKR